MTIFRMPSRTTLRTQDKCWPYWPAFLRSERTEADWERVLEFFYHYTHSDVVDGKPFYAWGLAALAACARGAHCRR